MTETTEAIDWIPTTRERGPGLEVRVVLASLTLALTLTLPVSGRAEKAPLVGDLRKAGTVHLEACAPAAREDFQRAVALLHSFFYDEARAAFGAVAAKDPQCAMAHWGVAMTLWHPLWTAPTADDKTAGQAAITKAKTLGGKTEIERGYIASLDAFFSGPALAAAGPMGQSCHGPTGGSDHPARALAYEKAMAALYAQYPNDVEVATFYALGLLGTAPLTDRTLANQTRATDILERFYDKYPGHPGIVHYLIHGYDFPSVAHKGLRAAKAYAEIAPWVPHVLHMPSHIFTRLGMWPEVIQSNLQSADAARQHAAAKHPQATSFEELHAIDYLVYGYLQTGQDGQAKAIVDRTLAVGKTHPEADFAAAYALGAVPARYALERRRWADAVALKEPQAGGGEKYPFAPAHVAFARALGAARSDRADVARQAIVRLEQLTASMTDPRLQYFAKQAEMQTRAVRGWLAAAEGRAAEGEALLREAADADDALGKHPVSPGSLLPAREILADFLLERGRPVEALAEYESCLKINPRRLNSLYGAGRAAEATQQSDVARTYYTELTGMVVAEADRPEVAHARAFLVGAAPEKRVGR